MSEDPFAAPESDFEDTVRNRARNGLYMSAATALSLAVLQFCCNPCLMVTLAAAASSINAIRQPKWLEISLEDDYPRDAGTISVVSGYIGLALCGLMLVIQVLAVVLQVALLGSDF